MMNISRFVKPFILSLGLVAGLSGCIYDPHHHGSVQLSFRPYFYPHYYDYYYYPSVQVYFSFSTGYYYYPSGKHWKHAKHLPPHIRIDSRERVITRVEGDKPYLKNKQHKQRFKPSSDYRANAKYHREEQDQNIKLYRQHQKKQKVYAENWKKRKKKNNQLY